MGKSATTALFAEFGIPVWDADEAVHLLYRPGGAAVEPLSALFPRILTPEGGIDRAVLARHVVEDKSALPRIEAIVHPLVSQDRDRFWQKATAEGAEAALSDIPLLFELGLEKEFDQTILVSAPEAVRRKRVMARPGMTREKYDAIVARQMPDAEKRERADFVITTDKGIPNARRQVRSVLEALGIDIPSQDPQNR